MKDKERYLNCKYLDAGMDGMLCSSLCSTCIEFNGEKCFYYTPKNKLKEKQTNKNILFVNDQLIKRNQELEEALLDMVVQFCQMSKEGYLHHSFMSAEENAFDVLDIKYGEKVDDVYERFNKKWGQENE